MRVYDKLELYTKVGDTVSCDTLSDGTLVRLAEIENSIWAEVSSMEGKLLGYAKDGVQRAIDPDSASIRIHQFCRLAVYRPVRLRSHRFHAAVHQ